MKIILLNAYCNKTYWNFVKPIQSFHMRQFNFLLILAFALVSLPLTAQMSSPDDFISHVRDKGNGYAFTLPGWFLRAGGNLASRDMEERESAAVKELLEHIKKLRFVFTEHAPKDFKINKSELSSAMRNKKYESLIQVRDGEMNVDLWAEMNKNDVVKNIFLSVFEGKHIGMIKIKTDLDLTELQNMAFFKDLQKESMNP